MEKIELSFKCSGTTRPCRQKLLEKMYFKDFPFKKIQQVKMILSDYKGKRTYQIFVNDIDIGFVPFRQFPKMPSFEYVDFSVKLSESKRFYYFFLNGFYLK